MKRYKQISIIAVSMFLSANVMSATEPKAATKYTIEANQAVLKSLPFSDKTDFKNAQRGFIVKPDVVTIKG